MIQAEDIDIPTYLPARKKNELGGRNYEGREEIYWSGCYRGLACTCMHAAPKRKET